jgi:hypothetical protein
MADKNKKASSSDQNQSKMSKSDMESIAFKNYVIQKLSNIEKQNERFQKAKSKKKNGMSRRVANMRAANRVFGGNKLKGFLDKPM